MLHLSYTSQKCVLNCHSFHHWGFFGGFFDSILVPGIKFLHTNSILPALLSTPAHLQLDLSVCQKTRKILVWPNQQHFEYKASLCHAQPVKEHPSHWEHPNTHAPESCATTNRGLHTFILTLPKFGTPAFTNPTVFWMAAWDKQNTDKRSGKSLERDQFT